MSDKTRTACGPAQEEVVAPVLGDDLAILQIGGNADLMEGFYDGL
jgi:hypothetical protein